jgi:23S rRNA pseudouridine1911/1915/1917 synthase
MKPKRPTPSSTARPNSVSRLTVGEPGELLPFLRERLPQQSRNRVKDLLRNGQVSVDGEAVTRHDHPLQPGQQVAIQWTKPPEEKRFRGLRIVFEDEHLVVIDKAAGLLSIATAKEKFQTAYSLLSDHVKAQNPRNRLFVVHRLDRDTSGLMLFAKSEPVQQRLQEAWTTAVTERTYLALAEGSVPDDRGTIRSYLHESKALVVYSDQNPHRGQWAVTHYETLRRNAAFSLLKVTLETGRKNQIRVHLQDLGHPVVGDGKYGATTDPLGRLGLHAWVLAFTHPVTGQELRFDTPVPRAFLALF